MPVPIICCVFLQVLHVAIGMHVHMCARIRFHPVSLMVWQVSCCMLQTQKGKICKTKAMCYMDEWMQWCSKLQQQPILFTMCCFSNDNANNHHSSNCSLDSKWKVATAWLSYSVFQHSLRHLVISSAHYQIDFTLSRCVWAGWSRQWGIP